ncbi:MAG: DNA repair protein RecN [Deltaproteobacteria bacterium]|nr:DNA repair protein RecN [Deltaproteobacteria bacterium]
MLVQLNISNFAIIKHLEVSFKSGLNIISGETGAGKSIIINAMNLILGSRASSDLIRTGCGDAGVEALFSFPESRVLKEILSGFGIAFDGELLIRRTISREGRNRILINGSIATLQMLSGLGTMLISISGQFDHQRLLKPDNHLYILDDFSGLGKERIKLNDLFSRRMSLKEDINKMQREISKAEDKRELVRFQVEEIDGAGLSPGEDETLLGEKKRLQHAEELLAIVTEGYEVLYERDDSALSSVSRVTTGLNKGAGIDPGLGSIRDALAETELKLEDVSFALRDFRKTIPMDPQKLEDVVERLEFINRLKRKYCPTIEEILKLGDKLKSEIYNLGEKREKLDGLIRRIKEIEADILQRAVSISKKRKKAAAIFEEAVEKELAGLHMGNTMFRVNFYEDYRGLEDTEERTVDEINADGFDRVEFMISPNVGEELRPLFKIASGGELSRIMLAMKTILAKTASVETIIFDEVDSGISGAAAEIVGEKILSLAEYHQILCITHLPQIASQGQTHFLVKKEISRDRTQTILYELTPEERVEEIARLLGGRKITAHARAHAREFLER